MIDDDAQEIRNNKLPVLDDQIKDYEEDFPNDKEKRGNIRSCYDFFTWVISDSCLFSINWFANAYLTSFLKVKYWLSFLLVIKDGAAITFSFEL